MVYFQDVVVCERVFSGIRIMLVAILVIGSGAVAADEIWREGFIMPVSGIRNPYGLNEEELKNHVKQGKLHALVWPVEITGALLPYVPIRCFLDLDCHHAVNKASPNAVDPNLPSLKTLNHKLLSQFGRSLPNNSPTRGAVVPNNELQPYLGPFSFDGWTQWLGLYQYPDSEGHGVFFVPYPGGRKPDVRMGVSVLEKHGTKALTFSCAACHAENLFGRPVIGLTTRFPRANTLFYHGSRAIELLDSKLFAWVTGANQDEIRMLEDLKRNMQLVDSKLPQNLGLDTSLSQVGLSLDRRGLSANPGNAGDKPRMDPRLIDAEFPVADSKPSVWWNVKYKNRWLSDGALVAGNPIFTNFLWNEIGRGSDLEELEQWLENNQETVREITTMVYASEAPHITDFFDHDVIDLDAAKRGEKLFGEFCAKCHGKYIKNWDRDDASQLTPAERLKTDRVEYFEITKVKDVGTDPARHLGMAALLPLNDLEISKSHGIKLSVSDGYVPPPLVGIWARWPYFHNNSVPTLCDVLEPVNERPTVYYARPSINKNSDFDVTCNGYPVGGGELPEGALNLADPMRYDTRREGMSNRGHDVGITIKNGKYVLSESDKHDLVEFLQTL